MTGELSVVNVWEGQNVREEISGANVLSDCRGHGECPKDVRRIISVFVRNLEISGELPVKDSYSR